MKILGIDPSINHLGWGMIDTSNGQPRLVDCGMVRCDSSQGNSRYGIIAKALEEVVAEYQPDLCVIEWVTFEDSERGRELWRSGGIIQLSGATATCAAVASTNRIPYTTITAWQWKKKPGKKEVCPKPVIKRRVEKILGERKWQREDEWEALGLALWAWKHKGDYDEY